MGGRAPKRRGDRYEIELAKCLNDNLFGGESVVQRAALSGGGRIAERPGLSTVPMAGGADLVGTPGIFVEAKRTQRINVREALRQAEGNIAKVGTTDRAVVITRRDREATLDSVVAMRLDTFLEMYATVLRALGHKLPKSEGDES